MKKHFKSVSIVLCSLIFLSQSGAQAATSGERGLRYHPSWWPVCVDSEEAVSSVIGQNIDSVTDACNSVSLQLEKNVWTGGYERSVVMTTTYRIDHYDSCSGVLLWSEDQQGTTSETLEFNVVNPNLGCGLPSYVSNAPMTDQEAQAALPEALERCNALHTGPWPQ